MLVDPFLFYFSLFVVDVESHPKKGHELFQSNFFTRPPKQASL